MAKRRPKRRPMKTCEQVRGLLHALITNELDKPEAEPVYAHLAACEACRRALAEHVKLAGLLRANVPFITQRYFSRSN